MISIAPSFVSALAVKLKRKSFVLIGEGPKSDCFSVLGATAPDQRHVYLASGSATEINPPDVSLVFDQTETGLADSMRRRGVERDAWTLAHPQTAGLCPSQQHRPHQPAAIYGEASGTAGFVSQPVLAVSLEVIGK